MSKIDVVTLIYYKWLSCCKFLTDNPNVTKHTIDILQHPNYYILHREPDELLANHPNAKKLKTFEVYKEYLKIKKSLEGSEGNEILPEILDYFNMNVDMIQVIMDINTRLKDPDNDIDEIELKLMMNDELLIIKNYCVIPENDDENILVKSAYNLLVNIKESKVEKTSNTSKTLTDVPANKKGNTAIMSKVELLKDMLDSANCYYQLSCLTTNINLISINMLREAITSQIQNHTIPTEGYELYTYSSLDVVKLDNKYYLKCKFNINEDSILDVITADDSLGTRCLFQSCDFFCDDCGFCSTHKEHVGEYEKCKDLRMAKNKETNIMFDTLLTFLIDNPVPTSYMEDIYCYDQTTDNNKEMKVNFTFTIPNLQPVNINQNQNFDMIKDIENNFMKDY